MTRLERIKELFHLDDVQEFIDISRKTADDFEEIFISSKTEDEKYEGVYDVLLKYGLTEEEELSLRNTN